MFGTFRIRPAVCALGAAAILLVACSAASRSDVASTQAIKTTGTLATQAAPSQVPAASGATNGPETATPVRAPTTVSLTAIPDAAMASHVTTLLGKLRNPDDLATGPDGALYFSDIAEGTVSKIGPGGNVTVLVRGLSVPEGIIVLPDGALIIAEQGHNRLVRFDPATGQSHVLLQLQNRAGKIGVDGIILDAHLPGSPSLIVPDSANAKVLRAGLDGKNVQVIAQGFVRPVAAWVEHDGSVLVADEAANGRLARVRSDGRVETVARLRGPDDVIEDAAGHIYVNTLTDGLIEEVDARTGAVRVLVRGLGAVQGITFTAHGTLAAAVPGQHRIVEVTPLPGP